MNITIWLLGLLVCPLFILNLHMAHAQDGPYVCSVKEMDFSQTSCEQLCEQGDSIACNELGVLQYAKEEYEPAAEYFEQACNEGAAIACANLGSVYESGRGVEVDRFQAKELYEKACDEGSSMGCNNLGVLLYNERLPSTGNQMDYKSVELFQRACEMGLAKACRNFAVNLGTNPPFYDRANSSLSLLRIEISSVFETGDSD